MFQTLLSAYKQCQKNKRLKTSSAKFEINLEKELISLEADLKSKTYNPGRFSVFVVTEPKVREIFAAEFRDRVIHHIIVNHIQPVFEPKFIYDSFANRKNKGTHLAVKRLQIFARKITKNGNQKAFYLQADIKNFFPSINHNILFNLIKKHIHNKEILDLTKLIIFHDCTQNPIRKGHPSLFQKVPPQKSLFFTPKGQGLPIGNSTSQFFANVYLNELDQYVKHSLKCKFYVRYVDDFVILDINREKLEEILQKINVFLLEKLALELHPNKCKIEVISKGIDALGYVIKPDYLIVRKRVIKTLKRKLWEFKRMVGENEARREGTKKGENEVDWEFIVSSINSYYAHFGHAKSYKLRKNLWEKHFGILKDYLIPINGYKYFKLKKTKSPNQAKKS